VGKKILPAKIIERRVYYFEIVNEAVSMIFV
jgi:hypothetical protein